LDAFQRTSNIREETLFLPRPKSQNQHFTTARRTLLLFSHSNNSETEPETIYVEKVSNGNDEIPDDVLAELSVSQPSELAVMKDVRTSIFVFVCFHQVLNYAINIS
jgi:hypothetical protein